MFLMDLERRGGRGGEKEERFRLSQPRGHVRITSSKV